MADMVEFAKRVLPEPGDDGFEPTMELRKFGISGRLQQRWRKATLGSWGHVVGWEHEWRNIPHVFEEPGL